MSGYAVGELRFCAWCGRAYNYNGVSDLCLICQKRDSVEMQHMMPGQPRVKGNVMTSGKKGKFRYI